MPADMTAIPPCCLAQRSTCGDPNFNGTAVVIFQPAEEGGGGGREMVEDGLMDRFDVQEVYGMHNMPGLPAGRICDSCRTVLRRRRQLHRPHSRRRGVTPRARTLPSIRP